MRCIRVVEELRNQAGARAGDQRVAVLEQDLEIEVFVGANEILQLEQRRRVKDGNLAAKARRRDDKIDRSADAGASGGAKAGAIDASLSA